MIKEELEKEAEEYGIASREICADVVDSDLIAEAYLEAAEPREKEIAELKLRNQELLESCAGATMMYKDLQKAKEIIRRLYDWHKYSHEPNEVLWEEAAQLLKEVLK